MNRVTIEIYGSQYPITTRESITYVQELAAEIDSGVTELVDRSSASLPQALILMCLSYLDAYKKSEASADNLREQVAEYLEEASQAKLELTRAKAEIERLNRDHQLSMNDR